MERAKTIFLFHVLPTISILTIVSLAYSLPMEDCVSTVLAGTPLGILIGHSATEV